jgi:hypothetical protein
MITVTARFDGRVFVPAEPVDLPLGYELQISIPERSAKEGPASTLASLAEIATQFPENPDLPTDLAAQHDHYLYGMPKRP